MAETEAWGDSDHLAGGPDDPESIREFDYLLADPDSGGSEDRFDAFDASTWTFRPAPTPWYRTKPALAALVAMAAATVALVVAVVLLAFRGPHQEPASPHSGVSPTPRPSIAPPPPPRPAAPPAPAPSASEPPPAPPPTTAEAPAASEPTQRPPPQTRATKRPEINVTRAPISVAPQQRHRPG